MTEPHRCERRRPQGPLHPRSTWRPVRLPVLGDRRRRRCLDDVPSREAHARRCYGLLADDGLRSAQALADKICKAKLSDGFTARDVRRNQWKYLTTDLAVQAALDWLEDEGWLRANEVGGSGPGTGRRTYRYSINPKTKNMENAGNENNELA